MKARKILALTLALALCLALPVCAALNKKTLEVYTGVDIYVDGVEMTPTDANGKPVETFVCNGTTYVPLRAVSQSLGYNVNWNGEEQRVYIGEVPGMKQYLLDVCPPYQFDKYKTYDTITMAGKKYTKAFRLGDYILNGWALYNLDGQYTTLSFDIGHLDGADMENGTLSVYLDGELSFSLDLEPEDMPQRVTVPLYNALQMKLELNKYYGLGNVEIY